MKKSVNQNNHSPQFQLNEASCGNCWGHQEYHDTYVDKLVDIKRNQSDNFISRFVKKYVRRS